MGVMLDAPWNGVTFSPPTAIDIATIENAIVSRLNSQISSIEIASPLFLILRSLISLAR